MNRIFRFGKSVKNFLYGMMVYDTAQCAQKSQGDMKHLFNLVVMGNSLGIPIIPPYYSLCLLPFLVPDISGWKHRMLRELDFLDTLA